MHVITLSATYGTGGPLIGHKIAERLDVPFVDRAIPKDVASRLGVTEHHARSRDECVRGWLSRMLVAAAPITSEYHAGGGRAPRHARLTDQEFVTCTEAAIRRAIADRGGVILGRAGAIVLRGHPNALHVRLDGDPDRRTSMAMEWLSLSKADAREEMIKNDNARTAYVRQYYNADSRSSEHYHLTLDATRMPIDSCVDVIVSAAKARHPVG